jgi:hypothetical protein
MNLDPVDIFGETIGGPIKRGLLFLLAMVMGGWIGEISANIDAGSWEILGWEEIISGLIWPLGVVLYVGPLPVVGLIIYVFAPSWLEWIWCFIAAGTSAVVVHHYEADTGWLAWFALNAGLVGVVWVHTTWRRARWAKELFELNAENAIRNRMRQEELADEPEDGPEDDEEPALTKPNRED